MTMLTEQLTGLEDCKVRVTDYSGETRTFWVGVAMGGTHHLELYRKNAAQGTPAQRSYRTVRVLGRPRRNG